MPLWKSRLTTWHHWNVVLLLRIQEVAKDKNNNRKDFLSLSNSQIVQYETLYCTEIADEYTPRYETSSVNYVIGVRQESDW